MLALYRSGRQADALEAYRAAALRLRDELGLEPGRPSQELERRHPPTGSELDVPAHVTSPRGPARPGLIAVGAAGRDRGGHRRFVLLSGAAERRRCRLDPASRSSTSRAARWSPRSPGRRCGIRPRWPPVATSFWAWVLDGYSLVRIDPRTGEVTRQVGIAVRQRDARVPRRRTERSGSPALGLCASTFPRARGESLLPDRRSAQRRPRKGRPRRRLALGGQAAGRGAPARRSRVGCRATPLTNLQTPTSSRTATARPGSSRTTASSESMPQRTRSRAYRCRRRSPASRSAGASAGRRTRRKGWSTRSISPGRSSRHTRPPSAPERCRTPTGRCGS